MKTLIFTALLALAGAAWADTTAAVVKVYSLDVKERIQNLELIDVSAEKTIDEQVPLEPELERLLDEVEALESEEVR